MADRPTSRTETDTHAATWLKPADVERLRDAALSSEIPTYLQDRNEALVALLYDSGIRRAEAAALDTDHFDLDDRELRLPSHLQKGNAPEATLELGKWGADSTRVLRRYLRDRWKDTEALFPSRQSDRMSARSVSRVVTRLAEIAGVEPQVAGGGMGEPGDVTAHTLRHSVAYRIIREEGGRLEDVQLRLRHANLQTTDRIYAHIRAR